MKIQYLGDVNDYRKFALLRFLERDCGFKLGICWMLTGPDGRGDGNQRQYLQDEGRWRDFDPELFDLLAAIPARPATNDLEKLQGSAILGRKIVFLDQVMCGTPGREGCGRHCDGERSNPCNARAVRQAYVDRALATLGGSDLVFFDPDNGLEVGTATRTRNWASHKHLYMDEVGQFWNKGASVLIYQHWPFATHDVATATKRRQITEALAIDTSLVHTFHTRQVLFLLVVQPKHHERLAKQLARKSDWWSRDFIRYDGNRDPETGMEPDPGMVRRRTTRRAILQTATVPDRNGASRDIGIDEAIQLNADNRGIVFQCPHCGGRVIPFRQARDGSFRAHFEHQVRNDACPGPRE